MAKYNRKEIVKKAYKMIDDKIKEWKKSKPENMDINQVAKEANLDKVQEQQLRQILRKKKEQGRNRKLTYGQDKYETMGPNVGRQKKYKTPDGEHTISSYVAKDKKKTDKKDKKGVKPKPAKLESMEITGSKGTKAQKQRKEKRLKSFAELYKNNKKAMDSFDTKYDADEVQDARKALNRAIEQANKTDEKTFGKKRLTDLKDMQVGLQRLNDLEAKDYTNMVQKAKDAMDWFRKSGLGKKVYEKKQAIKKTDKPYTKYKNMPKDKLKKEIDKYDESIDKLNKKKDLSQAERDKRLRLRHMYNNLNRILKSK